MPSVTRLPIRALAAFCLLMPLSAAGQAVPQIDPEVYSRLHWRNIGPEGNRFSAAAGIPGDPHTYYVGAASGGIWKTTDGGVNWEPVFDDHPVQSIGSLAVSLSDPNVVWAGTGETYLIRPAHAMGDGIYRSTDAGRTWAHMGLERTGRIGRIRVGAESVRRRPS